MADFFDVFDAAEAAPVAPPSAQEQQLRSLLGISRGFVGQHASRVCSDLREAAAPEVAAALADAARRLDGLPSEIAALRSSADMGALTRLAAQVDDAAWGLLQTEGWQHVCWREAFVLSQLMRSACDLCAADSAAAGATAALQRLDKAFILGGPPQLLRGAMRVLEPPQQQAQQLAPDQPAAAADEPGARRGLEEADGEGRATSADAPAPAALEGRSGIAHSIA